ncbi:MAG: pyridoxal-phosphate dependent enzyme [Deltaproteobacteria bacterium]|nr:pyridoxal-phosphate dependent enzyme [Deltaproteobacteria bacterium]
MTPESLLDSIPRLGLVGEPAPVTLLPELAASLGLGSLAMKRDDLLSTWHGGTKLRKLDYLLAEPRFRDAPGWVTFGATGSGHLVATTSAARALQKTLDVFMFYEPVSFGVLENLAFTISGPTRIHYAGSRVEIGIRHPSVLLSREWRGLPVIPPGASTPLGSVGLARAAFELADQVARKEVPTPHHLFVPLGSAGTAAGLWAGLAHTELRPTIHAVATVEHVFSLRHNVTKLARATSELLVAYGLPAAPLEQLRLEIHREQLGPGYGISTRASERATARLQALGLAAEPIYSGKAFASLLERAGRFGGENVCFWLTPRRFQPLEVDPSWRARLPRRLERRLAEGPGHTRRNLLLTAAGMAGVATFRTLRVPSEAQPFSGQLLNQREAHLLRCAAEVIVPKGPRTYVAENIDRFLIGQPPRMLREVRALFMIVDQIPPFGGLTRFSMKSLEQRAAALDRASRASGPIGLLYRGVRDLVMLGVYQDPTSWPAMGYPGPWLGEAPRPDSYAALLGQGAPRRLEP